MFNNQTVLPKLSCDQLYILFIFFGRHPNLYNTCEARIISTISTLRVHLTYTYGSVYHTGIQDLDTPGAASELDDFNDDDDYNAAHVSHVDEERLAQRLRDSASVSGASVPVGSDAAAEVRRTPAPKASASGDTGVKQQSCKTCNREVGDAKQYREHFKSDWHKHNLKRKMSGLPPLSAEECLADTDVDYGINDRDEYSR